MRLFFLRLFCDDDDDACECWECEEHEEQARAAAAETVFFFDETDGKRKVFVRRLPRGTTEEKR